MDGGASTWSGAGERSGIRVTPNSWRSALRAAYAWKRTLGEGSAGVVGPVLAEATEELIGLLLERGDHVGRVEAWRRARAAKSETVVSFAQRSRASAGREPDGLRRRRLEELLAGDRVPMVEAGGEGETLPPLPVDALVEYHVMGEDVIAFVVRDGQVDARILRHVATDSQRLVRAWQQECRLIAPGALGGGYAPESSPALDGLGDMLVTPNADDAYSGEDHAPAFDAAFSASRAGDLSAALPRPGAKSNDGRLWAPFGG